MLGDLNDEFTPRRYRLLDITTKLVGVGLVAVALELGSGSIAGLTAGIVGVAIATATVFIDKP